MVICDSLIMFIELICFMLGICWIVFLSCSVIFFLICLGVVFGYWVIIRVFLMVNLGNFSWFKLRKVIMLLIFKMMVII